MGKKRAERAGGPKPARGGKKKARGYRRAASLVVYWQNGRLIFENFALRSQITAAPFVCSILQFCGEWRSLAEIQEQLNKYNEGSVLRTVEQLCAHGMLERSDRPADAREVAMRSWGEWNPAAGFFHFSTKDVEFTEDPWAAIRELQKRAKREPMPLPVKTYPKARHTKLARVAADTEFPRVLRERRTWRKYSEEPVEVEELAAALELTFGIQEWAELPGLGKAAMKTSPSGGSLHPMEAYVVAMRVRGLKKGIYHYNGAKHELDWLRGGVTRKELQRDLGHQEWFADSAFLIVMTAVFGRTQWKYDFPRVYRGILLEAGHLCQTFCLTATWLGLAPFCTIALADTKWEAMLGIDGVRESVIYAAGAGKRPLDESRAHMGRISG